MNFRFILSVIVCKVLIFFGKAAGKKGSSTPGQIALKICPEVLTILSDKVKKGIVCTLGTNGKTTTNNMINDLFVSSGAKTVCNKVGANMLYGVITAFVDKAGLFGSLNADYAVIECDEMSAKKVFDYFKPDYIVITNLFRDQLDRYGEIDITINYLKQAVEKCPDATLVLNCDDPLCNYFSYIFNNKVVRYGVNESVLEPMDEMREGRFCQCCQKKLEYEYYHYSQLGKYRCTSCDFKRDDPDFYATNVKCDGKVEFLFNNRFEIRSNTYGFYNIYNILAAVSICEIMGVYIANYTSVFQEYEPQIARMEEFDFSKPVILNLSKNPTGFNQAIATIKKDTRKKAVVIGINDNAQDGKDISWLYDVDFEKLENLCAYGVSGTRKYDMALRLYYADVCQKPNVFDNPVKGAVEFLRTEAEVVYVLVNYTLIFDTQKLMKKALKQYKKEHGIKEEKI